MGTPANQPHRKISADVDESLEANSHHMPTIAANRLPATDAAARRLSRAAATIKMAGPKLNTAGCSPSVSGLALDQLFDVHVHRLPIDDPTTETTPYSRTRRRYDPTKRSSLFISRFFHQPTAVRVPADERS